MSLALRYAARSDRGLLREGNEDSLYAGPRLLVVADGMGGHAAGEVASAIAVGALAPLDEDAPGGDLLDTLADALDDANEQLRERVRADAELEGMGTTVTALLFAGSRVGVVHIGDSRAYLLRDGLTQITEDHTLVQSFVREGRISADEASTHPQRSLLTRALDGRGSIEPDLSVREAKVGDRYLLCTDGLSGVVSDETMQEALARPDLGEAVDRLVELALRAGGPDNVSVVLAEVIDGRAGTTTPIVDGAAAEVRRDTGPSATHAAGRAALAGRPSGTASTTDTEPMAPRATAREGRSGRRIAVIAGLTALVLGGTAAAAWAYVRSQYYVGVDDDRVAIFQGVEGSVAGVDLATVEEREDLTVDALPAFQADRVRKGIPADDRPHAERIVGALQRQARACAASPLPTANPTGTPTAVPTAVPTPSGSALPSPTSSPLPVPTTDCVTVAP